MENNKEKHKLECTADKHKNHLCFLMCEGWHLSHREEYKAIVKNAEYRCQACDRTAQKADNLCEPVKL